MNEGESAPDVTVRSKIVATVGPACRQRLGELVDAGVDVFRLNMAHGTPEVHGETIRAIRLLEQQRGRPLAVLVDLAGPKIRLGKLRRDPLPVERGQHFRLLKEGPPQRDVDLTCSYRELYDDLQVGDAVLLADGTVRMRVTRRTEDYVELVAESWGEIRSHQGINLPGVALRMETITPEDAAHARWAVEAGADFLSLSFVRSVQDVRQLRRIIEEAGSACGRQPLEYPAVVAKIEKREALTELEPIVQAADAIMVARGDLGVEVDVAETPVVQKRILAVCHKYGRPAIVATQMLDSMQSSPRPTRAEVTDVANAVLDGADACMLSGETAVGAYPVESVAVMNRVLHYAEQILCGRGGVLSSEAIPKALRRVTAAIVAGAGVVAEQADANLVAVLTRSGATALALSQQRLAIPVLGASHIPETARKMCLYWGVEPVCIDGQDVDQDGSESLLKRARELGWLEPGARVVFVTGKGVIGRTHNEIAVHEVPAE